MIGAFREEEMVEQITLCGDDHCVGDRVTVVYDNDDEGYLPPVGASGTIRFIWACVTKPDRFKAICVEFDKPFSSAWHCNLGGAVAASRSMWFNDEEEYLRCVQVEKRPPEHIDFDWAEFIADQ